MTAPAASRARPGRRRGGRAWPLARLAAAGALPLSPVRRTLAEALGCVLAEDLTARNDLPAADNSAMDGWAVAGRPPWRIVADRPAGTLPGARLRAGEGVRIATGASLPPGAEAVVPVEDSTRDASGVRPVTPAPRDGNPRSHIRYAGEEARAGDLLLSSGALVTPPVLGLAAAAGNDTLLVVPAPRVEVLVLGDELLDTGPARNGCTRDALGPQLPGWLAAFGVRQQNLQRLPDRLTSLTAALRHSGADVIVTTGGTSAGPRDHVHAAVHAIGGRLLVDGVDVKPGHPMMLASLPRDRWLVGLPGNPFAACAALVTLVEPLLFALAGRPQPAPDTVRLSAAQPGRVGDGHRLLPVARGPRDLAEVLPSCGSAMLRGLAAASGLAVVEPHGAAAGDRVSYLSLPWAMSLPAPEPPGASWRPGRRTLGGP